MRLGNYPLFQTTDPEEANKQFTREFQSRTRVFSPRFSLAMRSVKLSVIGVSSTVSQGERETWTEYANAPYALIVRRTGRMRARLHSEKMVDFEPGQIRLFPPDAELFCAMSAESAVENVGVAIPAEYLRQQAERIIGHPVDRPFRSTGVFNIRSAVGQRIEWILNDLDAADSSYARNARNGALSELNLITAIIEQTPNTYRSLIERKDRTYVSMWHIRRAEEWMLAHLFQPFTIADAAHAAGIGKRALEKHYRKFRDKTPTDFRNAMLAHYKAWDRPK